MTLKEIIKLLRKYLLFLIITALVCGVVSAVYAWKFMPDEYTSKIAIYVLSNKDKQKETNTYNEFTELNYGINFSQQLCNDVVELVNSDRIKDAVCIDIGEDDLKEYNIDVKSSEKNRVITLSVTAKDPVKSLNAVKSLAQNTAILSKEVTDADSVNVIDNPDVPTEPSGPARILICIVAILAGLFVALGIILIRDVFDSTIKSREELAQIISLPVLTNFPKV